MLAHPNAPIPALNQVVSMPVFTSRGRLVVTPGFDEESGIFLAPPSDLKDSLELLGRLERPSQEQVQEALCCIDELLHDFPFVSPSDKAHTVALFLLPFVRAQIDGPTPLHLMFKPTPGTGATLLASVVSQAVTGAELEVLSLSEWEPEQQRTLTAVLSKAPTYLLLDNAHKLEGKPLAAAITAPVWTDRRMGSSDPPSIPIHCAWIATGNNPVLSSEIRRRTIPIHLDAKTENPEHRTQFRHPNIRQFVREQRPRLVQAAITLIRGWQTAGSPRGTRTLGNFESWAQVLGGILDAAQVEGFLKNLDELHAPDAETVAWTQFYGRWWAAHEGKAVGVAQVYRLIDSDTDGPIDLHLDDGGGRDENARKTVLGKRLAERRDRIIGGFRLVSVGKAQRAAQWRLERPQQ
jgi:hypothetical protein